MIPDAVAHESEEDQYIFHAVSEVSTLPEPAPVGIRRAVKFEVPTTSSIYAGVCIPIPMAVPLL